MNNSNRDLLVLFNHNVMTPQAIEHEVEQLHGILYVVESINNVIAAHEVIDANRRRRITDHNTLLYIFGQKEVKPFTFIGCRN
jgi:hypothetical protein